jgi:hypothetical protein
LLVVSDVKWNVHRSMVHAASSSHGAELWKRGFGRGWFSRQSAAGMNKVFPFSPIRSVHGQFESDSVVGYGMADRFHHDSAGCSGRNTSASMAVSED